MKKAPHAGQAVAQEQQQKHNTAALFTPDPPLSQDRPDRPVYVVRLRPKPGASFLDLRAVLKYALRAHRLVCVGLKIDAGPAP
jgi:hypothetical protein